MKKKSAKFWAIQKSVLQLVLIILVVISQTRSAIVPPPWSDPMKNPCASLPGGWQLLYWPPLKKCFKIFQIGYPCPETMELSPAGSIKSMTKNGVNAECRCPPGTALSAITNECHNLFERGPCDRGQFFSPMVEISGIRNGNRWGTCKIPRQCPKGMISWQKDKKCYTLFTRGPCGKGKLLIMDDDGLAECKCTNSNELAEYFYSVEETCHEHYTKGPCPGQGSLFLPGGKCGCEANLPNFHEETNRCYELGTSGPCPPGHIFVIPDNSTGIVRRAKCECKEGYVLWEDGICYRLYTRGPCDTDEFLINSTSCTQNFCGKGRLYFPDQKSCYRIGSQGPCSLYQVVIFDFTARPSIDGVSFNGMCGCSGVIMNLDQQCTNANTDPRENTCESSPGMVELEGNCYKLYSRGPCGPGQWLEPFKPTSEQFRMTSKAKCQCRPGYTSYESQSGIIGCYAPSVGLARYLNGQNSYQTYKFQFRRFMSLLENTTRKIST